MDEQKETTTTEVVTPVAIPKDVDVAIDIRETCTAEINEVLAKHGFKLKAKLIHARNGLIATPELVPIEEKSEEPTGELKN